MVDSGRLRSSASTVIFWQWALGIGVGAACAGAVFVIGSQHVAPRLAVMTSPLAELSQPVEATGTATVGGTPLTTATLEVSLALDTPPPAVMLPPEKPAKAPKPAVAKAGAPAARTFRAREAATATVAHFESCLPSCETRDPLVTGSVATGPMVLVPAPAPMEPSPVVTVTQEPSYLPAPMADASVPVTPDPGMPMASGIPAGPVPPLPLLEAAEEPIPAPPQGPFDYAIVGSRTLFDKVGHVSGAVVTGTRRAVDTAVDLVW